MKDASELRFRSRQAKAGLDKIVGGKGEIARVKREDKVGQGWFENRAEQALIGRLWMEGKKVVALVKQAIA